MDENARHPLMKRRRPLTQAEAILWSHLRRKGLGVKFRRQHPVGPFVAGFACISARLIVDVREAKLNPSDEDQRREEYFRRDGWRMLHVGNSDIYRNLNGVLAAIASLLPAQEA
jgi:very-short-patch-repair endonuclease